MAFLHNLKLNNNIAKNVALRENFFMMAVCVELRIPLFLVGKPGSSKSLSKTILDHNMQGRDSESPLFKSLKQVNKSILWNFKMLEKDFLFMLINYVCHMVNMLSATNQFISFLCIYRCSSSPFSVAHWQPLMEFWKLSNRLVLSRKAKIWRNLYR